jgi:hypothetical protein
MLRRLSLSQVAGSEENDRAATKLACGQFQGGIFHYQLGQQQVRSVGLIKSLHDDLGNLLDKGCWVSARQSGGDDAAGGVEGETAGGQPPHLGGVEWEILARSES